MAKKIYRIISWGLLILTLVSIVLALRKPTVSPVESSPQAARSFDQKLNQLEAAHRHGAPQEVRITESELNSKLQESLQTPPAGAGGPASLKAATLHLQGDELIGIFTVNMSGKDLYLTLGGKLSANNGVLQFTSTEVKMGSLPLPASAVDSTLRSKLNSPEMRDHMALPGSIRDVRIEGGELVLESK